MSIRAVGSGDTFAKDVAKGIAVVAGLALVIYVIKQAAERNRVTEECRNGAVSTRCLNAVVQTLGDAGPDIATVAVACFPPVAPGACIATAAGVLHKRVNLA